MRRLSELQRMKIALSVEPGVVLARRFGVSLSTVAYHRAYRGRALARERQAAKDARQVARIAADAAAGRVMVL